MLFAPQAAQIQLAKQQEAEQARIKEEQRIAELRIEDPLAADVEVLRSRYDKDAKEAVGIAIVDGVTAEAPCSRSASTHRVHWRL